MGVFDERRKKLGISTPQPSSSKSSTVPAGGGSAFERRRAQMEQDREERRQQSIREAKERSDKASEPKIAEGKKVVSSLTPGLSALRDNTTSRPVVPPTPTLKELGNVAALNRAIEETKGQNFPDNSPAIVKKLKQAEAVVQNLSGKATRNATGDKSVYVPEINPALEPLTDFFSLGGYLFDPSGMRYGKIANDAYKGAGALLDRAGVTNRLGRSVAQGATTGAVEGAYQSAVTDQDVLQGAALGAGLGAAAPVVGKAIGAVVSKARGIGKAEQEAVEPARSRFDARREELSVDRQDQQPPADDAVQEIPSNPVVPVREQTPSAINELDQTTRNRGNLSTQVESGRFSPDLQEAIKRRDNTYTQRTHAGALEEANAGLQNLSEAEARFLGNRDVNDTHIATGYRLMQELDRMGEYERAANVSSKLMEDLTKAGQSASAARIIQRLSPEGQLMHLQRVAKEAGQEVSTADQVAYTTLAKDVQSGSQSGEATSDFMNILNKFKNGETVTPDELKQAKSILSDAQKYLKPVKETKLPTELTDVRKRDKVLSYLEKQAEEARKQWNAKRNIGFAQRIGEPDLVLLAKMGTYQLAKGAVKVADFTEAMVKELGEDIRPYVEDIYDRASKMIGASSRHISEGNLDKAEEAFRRMSGEASAEKEVVNQMSELVKKIISDVKGDGVDVNDLAAIKELSNEIARIPTKYKAPSQEQRFLSSVKSLAKKLSDIEQEKVTPDQANREVSSLIRQVSDLAEGTKKKSEPLDSASLKNLAHDLMGVQRPNPQPKSLYEKLTEKFIKENGVSEKDVDVLRKLAKDLNELKGAKATDADIQMQKILNKYTKSSLNDKLNTLRYIAMLFNTSTQAVNAASGPAMATLGNLADVFGTMADIAMSAVMKNRPRTTTLYGTNPLRFMAEYFKNLKVGTKAGWHGAEPSGIRSQSDIRGLAFKGNNPASWLPSVLERSLGAVSKGADYATYKTVFDSEIRKQAYLAAKNGKIKPADRKAFIDDFIVNPPDSAIEQADKIGKNTTFQRQDTLGGKLAQSIHGSVPEIAKPVVGAVVPFVRTPVNIASTAVNMTPAGVIRGLFDLAYRKDTVTQREAIRKLGLALTGTGIGGLGYYLADLGIITGANDSGDKNVDSVREQAGQGKYRFNTSALGRYFNALISGEGEQKAREAAKYQEGDKQFDYNKLQPIAFPLAAGASIQENEDKDLGEAAQTVATDTAGSLLGMSALTGIQNVTQKPMQGTQGEKTLSLPVNIIESYLKSFSPSLLAQEARRQDPIQRKAPYNEGLVTDVAGYFQSRLPGQSQNLPPSLTPLGDTKRYSEGVTGQYLNPYKSETANFNKAATIISDLIDRTGDKALAPSAPEKSVTGKDKYDKSVTIAIPPERYVKYQEEIGKEITRQILNLGKMNDADKSEKIKEIYSKVKETYRNKVKKELGIVVR